MLELLSELKRGLVRKNEKLILNLKPGKSIIEQAEKFLEHSKLLDEMRDELSSGNQNVINNLMDEKKLCEAKNSFFNSVLQDLGYINNQS